MKPYQSSISKKPNIAEFIERKYGEGFSLRQIKNAVSSEFKVDYCPQTIKNHLDRKAVMTISLAQGDKNLQLSIERSFGNIISDFDNINKKVWDIMENTGSNRMKLKCAKEIRHQLEFKTFKLQKMVNALSSNKRYIPLSVRAGIVAEAIENLKKEGYIQIINPLGGDSS